MFSLRLLSCFSLSLAGGLWSISAVTAGSWNPSHIWVWIWLGMLSFVSVVSLVNGVDTKSVPLSFFSGFSFSLIWIIWERWPVNPLSSWLHWIGLSKVSWLTVRVVSLVNWINCEMLELLLLSLLRSGLIRIVSRLGVGTWNPLSSWGWIRNFSLKICCGIDNSSLGSEVESGFLAGLSGLLIWIPRCWLWSWNPSLCWVETIYISDGVSLRGEESKNNCDASFHYFI